MSMLLTERLATAYRCDPSTVLEKIARCFALKRRYVDGLKHCN